MSNLIFPTLLGVAWPIDRSEEWSTSTIDTVSGRRFSMANWSIPKRKYTLTIEFLRSQRGFDEYQQLVAFIHKVRGSFDSFLFFDPSDCCAVNQAIGVGDGKTTSFQLVRAIKDFVSPVFGVKNIESLTVNGAPAVYTVSDNGVVTLQTPPSAGQVVQWSGTFYQRVRFAKDSVTISEFLNGFHSVKKLEFETVKP